MTMVVPTFTTSAPARVLDRPAAFAAVTSWRSTGCSSPPRPAGTVTSSTGLRRGVLLEDDHADPPTDRETVASRAVAGLARRRRRAGEGRVTDDRGRRRRRGLPVVRRRRHRPARAAPETLAAVNAARRKRIQISLNLALGSAMASIGLTIPAIAVASIWLEGPHLLELGPQMVLLALTVVVSVLTVVPGRATRLGGVPWSCWLHSSSGHQPLTGAVAGTEATRGTGRAREPARAACSSARDPTRGRARRHHHPAGRRHRQRRELRAARRGRGRRRDPRGRRARAAPGASGCARRRTAPGCRSATRWRPAPAKRRRWVIHTVGPNRHRGQTGPALLASCFTSSLRVAREVGARSSPSGRQRGHLRLGLRRGRGSPLPRSARTRRPPEGRAGAVRAVRPARPR